MDRRTLLASFGVTAAIGLAGCGGASGATGPTETDTESASVGSRSITTTEAGCGGPDETASVSFDTERTEIAVDGAIGAANPCQEATLAAVDDATGTGTVTVTVGTKPTGDVCVQCLGRVEYTATIGFEGTLPDRIVVEHGEGDLETVADVHR
ncbi:hypothetical protein [Halapricum desulfuricans]|uniref:Lipoprotein n=1 Tax=Halapricum desulfuricans TaxID=2841257 RepID=A0A897NLX9_9EURY|nr:hypothetical protein [Halapricum desulfuricans]QSG13747.1 Uncharacterized protein HSEST_0193 [Halapricum desulfuricans]